MQYNMLYIGELVSERKSKEIWLQVKDMSGGGELKKLTPTPSPEANRKEQVRQQDKVLKAPIRLMRERNLKLILY